MLSRGRVSRRGRGEIRCYDEAKEGARVRVKMRIIKVKVKVSISKKKRYR